MITAARFTGKFDRTGQPTGVSRVEVQFTDDTKGTFNEWVVCRGKNLDERTAEVTTIIIDRNIAEDDAKKADQDMQDSAKQPIPVTRPDKIEPVLTEREGWVIKARRLMRVKSLELTGKAAADVDALQQDVESTYQSGWIDFL